MVGTLFLVLSEGFDDMAFLACQVIMEENSYDVIVASKDGGAIKGEDSSAISVPFNQALSQEIDYSGLVLVGGNNLNWKGLEVAINSYNNMGRKIGAIAEGIKILQGLFANLIHSSDGKVMVDDNIITLLDPENSENFAELFVQELS